MKHQLLLTIAAFLLGLPVACSGEEKDPPAKGGQITVAFYNVENLFDIEDDPATNDQEFLPTGSYKWTAECYATKIDNLARVIDSLGDADGPEILGLSEVENKQVIEKLLEHPRLKDKGYKIIHENSPDQRVIDVAMIYKEKYFVPTSTENLRVPFENVNPDIKTRDILVVKGKIGKKGEVIIAVNHWPSRRGGSDESSFKREKAASVLREHLDAIRGANPDANIIVMGDLNDDPNNKSVQTVLGSSGDAANLDGSTLYNPWEAIRAADKEGSLMYRKQWDMFDQILLSKSLCSNKSKVKYVMGSNAIYHPEWMRVADGDWKGAPRRSHIRRQFYPDGFSDHFPVYIYLEAK